MQEMFDYIRRKKITWKFIISRHSWWDGFWERMVRSDKTPLKKALGKTCRTFEELETILTEIEAVMNSRPLCYLYEENAEPAPLTLSLFFLLEND